MKKNLLLLLLMCVIVQAQSQNPVSVTEDIKFLNGNSSYITFDMVTPLYIVNPRYSVGYITSITPQWKLGVDLGYGSDEISVESSDRRDQRNWSVFEIRLDAYRILNPTRNVQHYVGGELFFNYHENELIDFDFRFDDHMGEIAFDSADLQRRKYGLNFKYGVFIPFASQFGMNIYVGLGIRIRDNRHENVVNPRMNDMYNGDHWFERYHYYEGTKVLPNVAAGFKLFYKFE